MPGAACRNYRPKPIPPQGDNVRLIPLAGGGYVWVDADDYEWLRPYNWRLSNGYPCRHRKGKEISMHREIMQPPPGMLVDHADRNKQNACRSNLRRCRPEENQRNKCKYYNGLSRFKGVSYDRAVGKWKAGYRLHGQHHHLGMFEDEAEAARAYDAAAITHFGEFARVNFPREWPSDRRTRVREEYPQAEAAEAEKE